VEQQGGDIMRRRGWVGGSETRSRTKIGLWLTIPMFASLYFLLTILTIANTINIPDNDGLLLLDEFPYRSHPRSKIYFNKSQILILNVRATLAFSAVVVSSRHPRGLPAA
jgi:hypothetical protein